MPSAAYFRRQADICLRLSLIASDDTVSSRLIAMARDYMAASEALEREVDGQGPVAADRGEPSDVAPDQAALGTASDPSGRSVDG
jgi:hypothetical protein